MSLTNLKWLDEVLGAADLKGNLRAPRTRVQGANHTEVTDLQPDAAFKSVLLDLLALQEKNH